MYVIIFLETAVRTTIFCYGLAYCGASLVLRRWSNIISRLVSLRGPHVLQISFSHS